MEIKDCPEKLQIMTNELKKEHLKALDFFLKHSIDLNADQRNVWHRLRCVLDGKEKVKTIIELSFYENKLCDLQKFLKKNKKTTENLQKKRGIPTVVNTVPIILTDSEEETVIYPSASKVIENPVKLRQWNTPVPISDIIYPSSSKAIESPVKLRKYNTSVPISDINDLPVAIEVARISPQVAQFSPLVPDQPEITSRMPLSLDELFVAQHNFKERPPPILPEIRHNNKSNRYFKKNERRISHYHDKQQPHSSTDANKTPESYRDYKLRKETERIANNRKLQHTTVSSGSIQRRNDEPSTSSDFSMDLGEISSKFLENFAPTNNQSQISEPAEKPLPQLINCDNNYFSQFMPLIDEDILNPIQIKQEKVSEQSEEERCRGELTDENSNCETKVLIKQEPEEIFSNIDENTADFTELFNQQCVKEEPLDL